jgi:hypothetical protein
MSAPHPKADFLVLGSGRTGKQTLDVCFPLKSRRFGQGLGMSQFDPFPSFGRSEH